MGLQRAGHDLAPEHRQLKKLSKLILVAFLVCRLVFGFGTIVFTEIHRQPEARKWCWNEESRRGRRERRRMEREGRREEGEGRGLVTAGGRWGDEKTPRKGLRWAPRGWESALQRKGCWLDAWGGGRWLSPQHSYRALGPPLESDHCLARSRVTQ